MPTETKYYAVQNVSGVNAWRSCTLGVGTTEAEALREAYGCAPSAARKQLKAAGAWVTEIDADTYYEYQ